MVQYECETDYFIAFQKSHVMVFFTVTKLKVNIKLAHRSQIMYFLK